MKWALISVYKKEGIVEFAKGLSELGYGILSTGNTARILRESGVKVKEVSEHTGFPEILDGRVKTLHPRIHAGILARRDKKEHLETLTEHKIEPIDIVVVNLYPFEENPSVEMIDIGGPTLVRAAAKNYESVVILTDPQDYEWVLEKLKNGDLSLEERKKLASKAFALTSSYDASIHQWLTGEEFAEVKVIHLRRALKPRYGENPHQNAAFYVANRADYGFANFVQFQGKELSYNNIHDASAAYELILEFDEKPACAIIKHTNPCGVAEGNDLKDALERALSCDPVSAFGGIVAFNRIVDPETAASMVKTFFEVVVAPEYTKEALEIFSQKENLRVLQLKPWGKKDSLTFKSVVGGCLVQESDDKLYSNLEVVTKREPTQQELDQLVFALKVVKHVKSNAIVFAKDRSIIGVGAGQTSRVDSVRIAGMKAQMHGHNTKGAVMASDAFFPFPDGIEEAAKMGITAVIQPGGSIRDKEVIAKADELGIAMVFTRMRHFKH